MKLAQKLVIGYFRAQLNLTAVISPSWAAQKAFRLFTTPRKRTAYTFPDVFKKATPLQFLHNNHRINGFRWNEGAGKRLLILHGYESSCRKFDHHIAKSIQLGYEVLAFDAPAHGDSEGYSVNATQYADMIREAVALYGEMDTFICHSFGGIALSLFLEKHVHSDNTRIVFIAPATETTTAIDSFFNLLALHPRIRTALDQHIFQLAGHYPDHFSIKRALQHIKARILWVHDEEDKITPMKDVHPIQKQGFPNVEFHITKGLGHNRIYRDNEVKRKIFTFISG